MELLILCAGAADKSWTGEKSRRPLRSKGKRQAQKIGTWMGQRGIRPDLVLTSSDLRARVTAEKALKAAGWTARNIQRSPALAEGSLPELADAGRGLLVAPVGTVRTLMDRFGLDPDLAPGVLIRLSHQRSGTSLTARVDPKDLPDLFPYPAPDGPERRERPAYYYTQSAVIPYRLTAEGKEILIVGSSSGRHWVVPKGNVEPGLSPAESAVVEAREEAGVEGRIVNGAIGAFTYEKWGATCQVVVFAMEVTRVLSDEEWEEQHRTRKWMPSEEAAALLHLPEFRKIVSEL
ncbi:NUDIX domain-containing protein [uncultured Roseibium sp.]|uniref:NUDIX domain-containing protein n=1 Tax=uncultured Roseibium sp. TaxID=1936171 RepID=UPI0032167A71